jgi:Glycine rich protein
MMELFIFFWKGGSYMAQRTFNNTSTGRTGSDTDKSSGNLGGSISMSGGMYYWTVPTTGAYSIETVGAGGGSISGVEGGYGARMKGDFLLNKGEKLIILVGQRGQDSGSRGGSGGGGTFVAKGDSLSSSEPLIVAGGGAGVTALSRTTTYGNTTGSSGSGWASIGKFSCDANVHENGNNGYHFNTRGENGYGGMESAGGGGFYGNGGSGTSGYDPSAYGYGFKQGGYGGAGSTQSPIHGGFGGGGSGSNGTNWAGAGGGYSGGGGSNNGGTGGGIRGGGGSYNSGFNQINSENVGRGHGQAIITFIGTNIVLPDLQDMLTPTHGRYTYGLGYDTLDGNIVSDGMWLYGRRGNDIGVWSFPPSLSNRSGTGYSYTMPIGNYFVPTTIYQSGKIAFLNAYQNNFDYYTIDERSSNPSSTTRQHKTDYAINIPNNHKLIRDGNNLFVIQGQGEGFWLLTYESGGSSITTYDSRSVRGNSGNFNNAKMVLYKIHWSTLEVMRTIEFTFPNIIPYGHWGGSENANYNGFEVNGKLIISAGKRNSTSGDKYAVVIDINTGDIVDYIQGSKWHQQSHNDSGLEQWWLDYHSRYFCQDLGDYQTNGMNNDGLGYYFLGKLYLLSSSIAIDLEKSIVTIHDENVTNSMVATSSELGDRIAYRIKINDTFLTDDYSEFIDSPLELNFDYNADYFNTGTNKIYVIMKSESGAQNSIDFTVNRINTLPTIDVIKFDSPVHLNKFIMEFKINDADSDKTRYKVSLGDEILYDWNDLGDYSLTQTIIINNNRLNLGDNPLTIHVSDHLQTKSYEYNILKANEAPTIMIDYLNGYVLRFTVNDPDGDMVAFRIFVDGQPMLPKDGFGEYFKVPYSVETTIDPKLVTIGIDNEIMVEVKDTLGKTNYQSERAVFTYAGLVFCDVNETIYTDHIGYVLRSVNHGTLVAGRPSDWVEVWVKNCLGYDVKNVILTATQGSLDPIHEKVELTLTPEHLPLNEIGLGTIEAGQKKSFFIRVNADFEAITGGRFYVYLSADPL